MAWVVISANRRSTCSAMLRPAGRPVAAAGPRVTQRVRTSDRGGTSTDVPVLKVTLIAEFRALYAR
jgi:hypothetical protein